MKVLACRHERTKNMKIQSTLKKVELIFTFATLIGANVGWSAHFVRAEAAPLSRNHNFAVEFTDCVESICVTLGRIS